MGLRGLGTASRGVGAARRVVVLSVERAQRVSYEHMCIHAHDHNSSRTPLFAQPLCMQVFACSKPADCPPSGCPPCQPELDEQQDHKAFWTWRWALDAGLQVRLFCGPTRPHPPPPDPPPEGASRPAAMKL